MFKRLAKSPVVPYVLGTFFWAYMALLSRTIRWKVEGLEHAQAAWESDAPAIAASWHSRILLLPALKLRFAKPWRKRSLKPGMLISASRDGEFGDRSGRLLGLHPIRGSSANKNKSKDKRSFAGAREALAYLQKGALVCITVDGPRGPAEAVGMGPIRLAQQVGAPILIFGVSAAGRRLDTWDRFLAPGLFARGAAVFGGLVPTSRSMDSETLRLEVEERLRAATARADELCGIAPSYQPEMPLDLETVTPETTTRSAH